MKTIFTLLTIALSTTVVAQKTTTEPVAGKTPTEAFTTVTTISGIPESGAEITGQVVYLKECPLYILASVNNESVKLYPTNLPAEFHVHDLKLKFDYKVITKVEMPAECNFKAAVEVANVKKAVKGSKL